MRTDAGPLTRPGAKLHRDITALVRYARTQSPFYRAKLEGVEHTCLTDMASFARNVPLTRLEELIAQRIETGDPYSSRQSRRRDPVVTFQMEYPGEARLYMGLDSSDLQRYAHALSRCWRVLGLRRGDTVAIFDYGSSPLSYLASSLFTPYLRRGAADLLGCVPICNDGVPTMSSRAIQILKFVRPRLMFARADVLPPFVTEAQKRGFRLPGHVEALVVAENEGMLPEEARQGFERRLGVPVYRMGRVDAAMFLSVECPACRFFHTWPDLYLVEILGDDPSVPRNPGQRGSLAITNRFARGCPSIRFVSQLEGSLAAGSCRRGPKDARLAL